MIFIPQQMKKCAVLLTLFLFFNTYNMSSFAPYTFEGTFCQNKDIIRQHDFDIEKFNYKEDFSSRERFHEDPKPTDKIPWYKIWQTNNNYSLALFYQNPFKNSDIFICETDPIDKSNYNNVIKKLEWQFVGPYDTNTRNKKLIITRLIEKNNKQKIKIPYELYEMHEDKKTSSLKYLLNICKNDGKPQYFSYKNNLTVHTGYNRMSLLSELIGKNKMLLVHNQAFNNIIISHNEKTDKIYKTILWLNTIGDENYPAYCIHECVKDLKASFYNQLFAIRGLEVNNIAIERKTFESDIIENEMALVSPEKHLFKLKLALSADIKTSEDTAVKRKSIKLNIPI